MDMTTSGHLPIAAIFAPAKKEEFNDAPSLYAVKWAKHVFIIFGHMYVYHILSLILSLRDTFSLFRKDTSNYGNVLPNHAIMHNAKMQ